MLNAEFIQGAVQLAKRTSNPQSQRDLRRIAMREVAELFDFVPKTESRRRDREPMHVIFPGDDRLT